jgi:hypothetical protein
VKDVEPLAAELLSAGVTVMATPLAGSTELTVNTNVVGGGGFELPELPPLPHAVIIRLNKPTVNAATLRMPITLNFRHRGLSYVERFRAFINGNGITSR